MTRTSLNDFNCSLAKTADIIGDKWCLLIIRDALYGVQRFSEFQERLGIAKTVLSNRLNTLVENEILKKESSNPEIDRFVYKLTPRGKDLFVPMIALLQWGDRWISGQGREPISVLDKEQRTAIKQVVVQAQSGQSLKAREVAFMPGPGANVETISRFEDYYLKMSEQYEKER